MIPKGIVKEKAVEAILNNNVLQISYKKKNGRIAKRMIEPYEIKTEQVRDNYGYLKDVTFLYAYDVTPHVLVKNRSTKRWISDRFLSITIMESKTFKKRAW
jgi:hypothetical protein